MTRANQAGNEVLSLGVFLFSLLLLGSELLAAGPPAETGPSNDREVAMEPQVEREIRRIVEGIQVVAQDGTDARRLDLLEGPLLTHEFPYRFVRGTVWAWGKPGRPQAVLSLALTGRADDPQWCFEMVSLTTSPLKATTRSTTWWSPTTAGWNPKPVPNSPDVADSADRRLQQMKDLAARFSAFDLGPRTLMKLPLHVEPLFRYGPSEKTVDGAIFVFVAQVRNPEILLVVEAEREADGSAVWKYNVSPLSSGGLILKCGDAEVWNRPVINYLSTKPTDPYRIYLSSAKEEIRLREAEKQK